MNILVRAVNVAPVAAAAGFAYHGGCAVPVIFGKA